MPPNCIPRRFPPRDAGLAPAPRRPLRPQGDSIGRLLRGRPSPIEPFRSSTRAKKHFLPRTLSPSPTFPRAQLQKHARLNPTRFLEEVRVPPAFLPLHFRPPHAAAAGPPHLPLYRGVRGSRSHLQVQRAPCMQTQNPTGFCTQYPGQLILLISTYSPHLLRALQHRIDYIDR